MIKFSLSPWVPAALSVAYHFFPSGAFFPFVIATSVHELGHIAAVLLSGGNIQSIKLSLQGAVLETQFLSDLQEAACAIAGPLAGLSLILYRRFSPWLAFWGLAQSLFNLLPLYPLDGGRALACVLPYLPFHNAVWVKALAFIIWVLATLMAIF